MGVEQEIRTYMLLQAGAEAQKTSCYKDRYHKGEKLVFPGLCNLAHKKNLRLLSSLQEFHKLGAEFPVSADRVSSQGLGVTVTHFFLQLFCTIWRVRLK